ncbi:ABC transporter substrate-binding protein [Paenibacillus daejeonensis]|uniref:ABC transporter substrate-binding protein n=1 Tax=Paenibacillus daejeonensis TaxID=135193 RepID=UPI000367D492|nr:extracellular solute-binding protein [Paenibacillus daejeonensis]
MKARNWWVILCVFILVFTAACSSGEGGTVEENNGSNQGAETTNEGNEQNATEAEETATNPNATPEMDFDLGGRTIKLVSWYNEAIPTDSPDNIQRKENLDALMEKHNFTVEYVVVDYGEYRDKIASTLLAGDPLGDIIRVARPWMMPSLVQQDMFWPLDEYVINDNAFVLQYTTDHSQFDGKGYGFRIGVSGAASGVFYNRTLMNEFGMKPLQEYVDEDNWNWETFIQVAKEANKDTDNDGNLDRWGLATASMLIQALSSNETGLVDGNQQTLDAPQTQESLNFISRLATENVARPTEGGDWTEPKQFFLQGNTLMYPGMDYEANDFKEEMADFELGFLPFPQGPSASRYHTHVTIPNYYTIPRAVENPEQLVYLWEKIYDIESIYDYPKQADLEKFFSNEDDINNARDSAESIRVIEQGDYYPSMPYYELVDELVDGVSVSTVIEKYKTPFQAAIDEVWNSPAGE